MSVAEKGARARRKAERPGEILEAAFEEFVLHGFAATKLEDVAKRAGVTKGTIYFYFPDKEALFSKLMRDLMQPLLVDLRSFADRDGSTVDFLRSHVGLLYQGLIFDRRGRELLRLLVAEVRQFPELTAQYYQDVIGPADHLVRKVLKRGVERGEIRNSPAIGYPEIILGPAMALNLCSILFPSKHPIDEKKYFEAHMDLLLNGLLPVKRATKPAKS